MIGRDASGAGYVNVLAADKLMQSPRLYSTFLLWLLSELFQVMPEVGDVEKPKFVFFFDEAHLLFDDAPKALLDKIEQVVRLIRSKGVGVYFITQNPLDIPEDGAGPAQQPGAARAARLHAQGPEGGEDGGRHVPAEQEVQRRRPPSSSWASARRWSPSSTPRACRAGRALLRSRRRAAASARRPDAERAAVVKASPLAGKYERTVDRESAYEVLTGRATGGQVTHDEAPAATPASADAASTMPPAADASSSPGPWGRSRIPQSEPAEPPKPRPRLREAKPPGAVARAQGAGAARRFDRHDDHQDRGAYGDQRGRARGVEGHLRQRPQQRRARAASFAACWDRW